MVAAALAAGGAAVATFVSSYSKHPQTVSYSWPKPLRGHRDKKQGLATIRSNPARVAPRTMAPNDRSPRLDATRTTVEGVEVKLRPIRVRAAEDARLPAKGHPGHEIRTFARRL